MHTMAANFLYLLDQKGVAKDAIEKMQSVGITTMSRLALWVDTREDLRGVTSKEFGFDLTAGLETMTVMDAWESSKRRNEEEANRRRLLRAMCPRTWGSKSTYS